MNHVIDKDYFKYKTVDDVNYTEINIASREIITNKHKSTKTSDIENRIIQYIRENDIKVLSFDVFDTYLLRNSKPEAARYMELSNIILKRLKDSLPHQERLSTLDPADICLARIAGMQATYRTRPRVEGCGEGEIREVIAMQCRLIGLPAQAEDILLEAEIAYEAENLSENTLLARLARRFRKEGGKVILVSDMYLGADIIAEIIHRVVKRPVHQHLFSSADMVVSKRSGKIFPAIERILGHAPREFLHIGDSWTGDVERPRKAGWHAMHFPIPRTELNKRKAALAEFIREMDEKGINTRAWAKL
ncbi:HAD family hydrolase [Thermopetrobacter sp. TC1]|uniref:HAD family hydrolase n=1 Tax=Thermopetrobacter sp. TC1 TaxID=1495045 RepID=UPI0012E04D86|nr:HAD family hydrolase [Thermopetrobacter sp. TC1]